MTTQHFGKLESHSVHDLIQSHLIASITDTSGSISPGYSPPHGLILAGRCLMTFIDYLNHGGADVMEVML